MDALLSRDLRKANVSSTAAREKIATAATAAPTHVALLKRLLPTKQAERQFVEIALH